MTMLLRKRYRLCSLRSWVASRIGMTLILVGASVGAAFMVGLSVRAEAQTSEPTRHIGPPPALTPKQRTPPLRAGSIPPIRPTVVKSYADSVEFNKIFDELYPLVQPQEKLNEQAVKLFGQMYRRFKSHGVDSLAAWKSVEKSLDPSHDREAAFVAFRTNFTANELKDYLAFMKTPGGKKAFEVSGRLAGLRSDQQVYLSRLINASMMPMVKMSDGVPMQFHGDNSRQIAPPPPPLPRDTHQLMQRLKP